MLASSIVTGLLSAVSFYLDYQEEMVILDTMFDSIEKSSLNGISKSVWHVDEVLRTNLVNGIQQINDVISVEIISEGESLHTSKKRDYSKEPTLTKTYNLSYEREKNFGKLIVVATKVNANKRIYRKLLIFLLAQSIKTFFVCFIILWIFHHAITKHLLRVGRYLRSYDINSHDKKLEKFTLERRSTTRDELTILSDSINNMMELNLEHKIYQTLVETQEKQQKILAETVDARTKELEVAHQRIMQNEKMASLGRVVAGVAHELNTPIGSALTESTNLESRAMSMMATVEENKLTKSGFVDFLKNTGDAVKNIVFSLNRAADIISNFKQISVDQSANNRRKIDLGDYIKQTMSSMRSNISKCKIGVRYGKIDKIGTFVDPGIISQVITNLTMNSLIHAYDNQGPGLISIDLHMAGEKALIQFSDDGKGIDEASIKKIFDPFYTTKLGHGGSGLGLNVVYNLVHSKLKGSIECKSELGVGTTFKIYIPIEEEGLASLWCESNRDVSRMSEAKRDLSKT